MPEPSLTDFLSARIAEDENGTRPGTIRNGVFSAIIQYYGLDEADDADQEQASEITSAVMEHLRPRVLAECETKRRIIERAIRLQTSQQLGMRYVWQCVVDLAQPYADHEDFDASWRVE